MFTRSNCNRKQKTNIQYYNKNNQLFTMPTDGSVLNEAEPSVGIVNNCLICVIYFL